MMEAKEEVRARLAIEDVIGEYVQLQRAGRNFKGLSPFSGEKTPSFIVSPDKHIWHDFSSQKGGDMFAFIMEVEGLDFRAALEFLARKAGVDLSLYESKNNRDLAAKKKRLFAANELATKYFQSAMIANKNALEYIFKHRSLSKKIVQEFGIGYAPSQKNALVTFLQKKGFSLQEIANAGLSNRFGGDMFRGRMTVPLMDPAGQTIGFTARIIAEDPNAPKYLNTSQTLLYDKGRHVFGLSQAKEAIRTKNRAVIVEGNLDVVSSHQASICEVVATAGTAITEYHLKALARFTSDIRLAFDGDAAGLRATERAIVLAQEVGVELTIISLPREFKDADEAIQSDPQIWQDAIEQAEPVIEWMLRQLSTREDITTPLGKRNFTTASFSVLRSIRDEVERDEYLKKVAKMIDANIAIVRKKFMQMSDSSEQHQSKKYLKQIKKTPIQTSDSMTHDEKNQRDMRQFRDNFLAAAMSSLRPNDALSLLSESEVSVFFDETHARRVYEALQTRTELWHETPEGLSDIDGYVKLLLLIAEKEKYAALPPEVVTKIARDLLRTLATKHYAHKKNQIDEQLAQAEAAGDDTLASTLRSESLKLIKEIQHAKR